MTKIFPSQIASSAESGEHYKGLSIMDQETGDTIALPRDFLKLRKRVISQRIIIDDMKRRFKKLEEKFEKIKK